MNSVLKYQYDQIMKQLLLLQDHAAMRFCPYSPGGDACIRKHLLAVEAYADETEPMEEDMAWKEKLEDLESEARSFRFMEEDFLTGKTNKSSVGLEDWARKWRKTVEPYSLFGETKQAKKEATPSEQKAKLGS